MIKKVSNPCTQCGKERVLLKQWTDEIPGYGTNVQTITRSLNVCPDADCQKIVDTELAVQKKKRDKIKSDREEKLKVATDKKNAEKQAILDELE
jgi:hypothetical protein